MALMDMKTESDAIDDVALRWFVKMQSPKVSDAERAAFEDWLAGDPRHETAFAEAKSAWALLGQSSELTARAKEIDGQLGASHTATGTMQRFVTGLIAAPWRTAIMAATAAVIVFAGVIALQTGSFNAGYYSTHTAEIRTIQLPDGSAVDLAPESRIKVAYSEAVRRVTLIEGEAFFDVRKGENRVFVVAADDAEIEVVGTKFNVRRSPERVTVAVAEGVVTVRQDAPLAQRPPEPAIAPNLAPERRLKAGEQVVAVSAEGIEEIIEVSSARAGAWRTGHLVYRNTPLREVIADVDRYSKVPIFVAADELDDLRITAGFPTANVDEMLDGIEGVLPVTVDRSRRDRITIRPKQNG